MSGSQIRNEGLVVKASGWRAGLKQIWLGTLERLEFQLQSPPQVFHVLLKEWLNLQEASAHLMG